MVAWPQDERRSLQCEKSLLGRMTGRPHCGQNCEIDHARRQCIFQHFTHTCHCAGIMQWPTCSAHTCVADTWKNWNSAEASGMIGRFLMHGRNTRQGFSKCLTHCCPKNWAGRKLSPVTFGDSGLESFEIVSPSRFSCIGNRPMRFVNCQLCQNVCLSTKICLQCLQCLQMSPFVSKCLPLSPNVSKCLQMSLNVSNVSNVSKKISEKSPSFLEKLNWDFHAQTAF